MQQTLASKCPRIKNIDGGGYNNGNNKNNGSN